MRQADGGTFELVARGSLPSLSVSPLAENENAICNYVQFDFNCFGMVENFFRASAAPARLLS